MKTASDARSTALIDKAWPWLTALLLRLPVAPIRRQRIYALILLLAQAGIAVTGSIVRVSGSGLGCDTWPQCHPGTFVPRAGATPMVLQVIEFGNRLLTFVLIAICLVVFLSTLRARRRNDIILLAFISGLGIILQAVIGGISVLVDLHWAAVMVHFLPSMLLTWIAAMLFVRIGCPDDGNAERIYPQWLRYLAGFAATIMVLTLITGTMVTAAGPHAGDADIGPEDRLQLPIPELVSAHAGATYLLCGLVIGLVFALHAVPKVPKSLLKWGWLTVGMIVLQGVIGMTQHLNDVPEFLVPFHVAGSGAVVAFMGILWQRGYILTGGSATVTGSVEGDAEYAAKH